MSNDLDIARINYVLQNYDEAVAGDAVSYTFRNRDNTPAKSVLFSKKINGTYFVVEAVPNTGKVGIVTAFINKKGTSQVPDAEAPGRNVQNVLASAPDSSIADVSDGVKRYSIGEVDEMTDTDRTEVEELLNRASMEEDGGEPRDAWESLDRETLTGKAREHLEGAERRLAAKIAAALDVPRQAKREFLQPIVEELTAECMTNGTISQAVRDRLFETAWDQGRVADQEFYDTYKEVKDYLRTTGVTLSESDRDSRDWNKFRKSALLSSSSSSSLRSTTSSHMSGRTFPERSGTRARRLWPWHC